MNASQAVLNRLVRTDPDGIHLGRATSAGSLTLVPVFHDGRGLDYLTYAGAAAAGLVRVEELADGGAVSSLRIVNAAPRPLLLVEGEIISGLKQTRTVNLDVMVPAQTSLEVPVSCVERGRWSAQAAPAGPSEVTLAPRVRANKVSSVGASMRFQDSFGSDQGGVWDAVERELDGAGIEGGTRAFTDAILARRGEIDSALAALSPAEGQAGVLAMSGGHPLCLDVFDQARTLHELWSGLVASYAMDAHRPRSGDATRDLAAARRWLKKMAVVNGTEHPGVGLGESVMLSANGLTGSALVVEGVVAHVAVLPVAAIPGARFVRRG